MKFEIDTKFNIGDVVWFMTSNIPTKGRVMEINFISPLPVRSNEVSNPIGIVLMVEFNSDDVVERYPKLCYPTKRALVESLMDMGDMEEEVETKNK